MIVITGISAFLLLLILIKDDLFLSEFFDIFEQLFESFESILLYPFFEGFTDFGLGQTINFLFLNVALLPLLVWALEFIFVILVFPFIFSSSIFPKIVFITLITFL